jgi:hypothetical protein
VPPTAPLTITQTVLATPSLTSSATPTTFARVTISTPTATNVISNATTSRPSKSTTSAIAADSQSRSSNGNGPVVGGVIGGLIILFTFAGAGIFFCMRSRRPGWLGYETDRGERTSQVLIKHSLFKRSRIVSQPMPGAPSKEMEISAPNVVSPRIVSFRDPDFSGRLRED